MLDNEELRKYSLALQVPIRGSLFPQVEKYFKGNWIVDVGSNVGAFIDCSLELYPDAKILAFEPVRLYYEFTIDKYKDLDHVFIENLALSDKDGTGNIFVATKNIGWNTMVEEKIDEDNSKNIQVVKTTSFDLYLDYAGLFDEIVDILKIDTEGYEFKVIKGMERFLQRQKPVILCEVGWGKSHPFWDEELAAFDYLRSLGYKIKDDIVIESLEGTRDVIFTYEE